MAPKCTICQHKARREIDKALVADGASIRGIARQFRVSDDSLSRHVKNGHVEQKIKQAVKAQEVAEADDLLKEVQETEKITRALTAGHSTEQSRMAMAMISPTRIMIPASHCRH